MSSHGTFQTEPVQTKLLHSFIYTDPTSASRAAPGDRQNPLLLYWRKQAGSEPDRQDAEKSTEHSNISS